MLILKTYKDSIKKENHSPFSIMNIDVKILSKILVNQIQNTTKRSTYHDQIDFILHMQRFLKYTKVNKYNPQYKQAERKRNKG